MNFDEINEKGWMIIDGISSASDLLELGKQIGYPVRGPNGELVKKIKRIPKEKALPDSQSSIYDAGPFPLHTDTVFWPLPVKYVLFRAYGDIRRPTTVKKFSDLLNGCDKSFNTLADKSVWYVGPKSNRICCSMRFRESNSIIWRYDTDLMTPVNDAAREVNRILKPLVFTEETECITWTGSNAAIISNWNILHGRGPQPLNEGIRIVERLYIR